MIIKDSLRNKLNEGFNLLLRTKLKMFLTKVCVLISISILCTLQNATASHVMAVDLTYKCSGANQYIFTLAFYRDCKGVDAPTAPTLDINSSSCGIHTSITLFQVGPGVEVSEICNASLPNTTCNGGTLPGVQKYIYQGSYTLPTTCTDWVFSYTECCRNNLITNLAVKEDIYVEATLNNKAASCNSSPTFSSLPVPYICNGQPYTYNNGIFDVDGDSLVYSLINPLEGPGQPIGYNPGYSVSNPIITTGAFQFNSTTGDISLTPNGTQVCVVAVQVKEYKKGVLIGTTMRDMQVIVSNCTNLIPYITNNGAMQNETGGMLVAPNQIEVCPGTPVSFDIAAKDDDGNNITLTTNIATAIPTATFTTTLNGSTASGSFSWAPNAADAGLHIITVTVKDDACQVSGQQTYSFSINVLPRTTAGGDKYYCVSGGPVQINAVGGTVFSWTLLDGSPAVGLSCINCSNPKASPSVTTTYVVSTNYSGGCADKDTITVFIVPGFNITKTPDTKICSLKDGVQLSMTPSVGSASAYTYSWTPSESLSNANISNPVATPSITTEYYCTLTSPLGCKRTDSINVTAKNLIDLTVLPSDAIAVCDTVQLDLLLNPIGEVFSEPFDHEIDSTNWSSISGGILSQECGTVSEDAYFMNQVGTRSLTTKELDLSTGGVLSFYIKAGYCEQCVCDAPENDEEDENFYLDYSTNGGATWTQLEKMDADVYAAKNGFVKITITIPDAAKSPTTSFRWYQINHFPDKDVWILDNILIKQGLGGYKYVWTPTISLSNYQIKNPIAFPDTTTMYHVSVTDTTTGCVYKDSINVVYKKEFQLVTLPQVTICPDDSAYTVQVVVPGGQILTYTWTPITGVSNPHIKDPKVSPDTTTTYTVVATDPITGCYVKETVVVNDPKKFTVTANPDTSVCATHQVQLGATVSPADAYDYLWRPISGLSNQAQVDPIAAPTSDTEYILFVRNQATGCIKADSVKVKVYPDFKLTTSGSRVLCPYAAGVDIGASASPGNNFTYLWDSAPGITDPTNPSQFVDPSVNTIYSVLCHNLNGCWKRDSVSVRLYNGNLQLQASNDTLINEGDNAFLNATGALSYIWKSGSKIIGTTHNVTVSPETKTVYNVFGSDSCFTDTAKVTVEVNPLHFFIPNLITPNNDGKNDHFGITNFGKRWNLEIYNRWGKLVYKKDEYINEWGAENENDGIYYYHILDTKTNEAYKGWVEVLR